jgi:predicted O-linked N-acetylglucosamine transferase (SPINDLY family)
MEHPAEHVEHVEHQQHAAHSPFDRKVAMTMAIVAALLAVDTLLSHRSHNETLRLQAKAGIVQSKASDGWNYFQAKNIRRHEYEAFANLASNLAPAPGHEDQTKKQIEDWRKKAETYDSKDLPKMKKEAEEMEGEVLKLKKESEHVHHQSNWFDLGELGLELSLILCSIAVLTKRAPFWYTGIASAVIGISVAALGFFIQHH